MSPVICNAAFEAMDLDWVYVPLPVAPDELPAALRGLVAAGFAGMNVTMPHKTQSARLAQELSEDAKLLEAANTLVVRDGALEGHNTDAPGFERFLLRDTGVDPAGRTTLLYGAGGAARACALALARAGARFITVAAREPKRAGAIRSVIADAGCEPRVVPMDEAASHTVELIVNATPLGSRGETIPTPPLDDQVVVVDLLYEPAVTPLIAKARQSGAAAFGGLGLLLHQAALSIELWTGRVPPLEAMSAAALGALADRS